MPNRFYRARKLTDYLPKIDSGTSLILGLSVVVTLCNALLNQSLVMNSYHLQSWYLWTVLSSPFVIPQNSPIMVILLVGFYLYYSTGMAQGARFQAKPWLYTAAGFIFLTLINAFLPQQFLWAWLVDILVFSYFAYSLEKKRTWGRKKFLLFSASVLFGTYSLLALSLLFTQNESMHVIGLNPLHKAYFLAWGLSLGRQKLMWLNIEARSIRWLLLIFCLLELLLLPGIHGLSSFLGLVIAWTLLENLWQKSKLQSQWLDLQRDWQYLRRYWRRR